MLSVGIHGKATGGGVVVGKVRSDTVRAHFSNQFLAAYGIEEALSVAGYL